MTHSRCLKASSSPLRTCTCQDGLTFEVRTHTHIHTHTHTHTYSTEKVQLWEGHKVPSIPPPRALSLPLLPLAVELCTCQAHCRTNHGCLPQQLVNAGKHLRERIQPYLRACDAINTHNPTPSVSIAHIRHRVREGVMREKVSCFLHPSTQHQTVNHPPVLWVFLGLRLHQHAAEDLLLLTSMPTHPLQQLLHEAAGWEDLDKEDFTQVPHQLHH